MKKSGFTLIEMIVTIALLAFVGIVVGMNVVKVVNNQNDNKKETVVTLLEEAACAYSGLSTTACDTGCNVTVGTLIQEGFIDEEINGYNLTKASCKSKTIKVTINTSTGEKKCEFNKNYLNNCK